MKASNNCQAMAASGWHAFSRSAVIIVINWSWLAIFVASTAATGLHVLLSYAFIIMVNDRRLAIF